MTIERQALFWTFAVIILLGFIWTFSAILLPFVTAIVIAYLLNPIVVQLEKLRISRAVAAGFILILFVLIVGICALFAIPVLTEELSNLLQATPGYLSSLQRIIIEKGIPLVSHFGLESSLDDLKESAASFATKGASYVLTFTGTLISSGQAVISTISVLILTPILTFYVLVDWETMIQRAITLVPIHNRATFAKIATDIDLTLSRFIRGQLLICAILGTFYAIALSLIGLNFGFLIGVLAGILNLIPYIGSLIGLILSVGIAIAQFWPDFLWICLVAGIFVLGQAVEGNLLQPKLLGDAIGIHPAWLIFSLFAFGSLLGFLGVLIAVPLAAITGVLIRHALDRYRKSSFFKGHE